MDTRMTAAPALPEALTEVGARVDERIIALLDRELERWRTVDADLAEPLAALRALVAAGGKRLRPAFCYWTFRGAGGAPDDPRVLDAAAALELLHTFALVHDDVMDGSGRRRGRPTIHEHFHTQHRRSAWRGESRRIAEGAAILVGDFAFTYADVLLGEVGPEARAIFDELRIELCVGQYLDLVGTAGGTRDAERAARIARYKSGKYTVERPLQLGAALAGRLSEFEGPLSAVGIPLGEAFQLRDDLLGVFGDAAITGKPVGDDLREGKLTPLVAIATARADASQAALLGCLGAVNLGGEELQAIQRVFVDTGARDEVEHTIDTRVDEALRALADVPLTGEARDALIKIAMFAAWRDC